MGLGIYKHILEAKRLTFKMVSLRFRSLSMSTYKPYIYIKEHDFFSTLIHQ